MDGYKKKNKDLKLHLIGKLQSNKVKFVSGLFDYIHSLDSEKLAKKISDEQKNKTGILNYLSKSILETKFKKVEYA